MHKFDWFGLAPCLSWQPSGTSTVDSIMIEINLILPVPPSVNRYWRNISVNNRPRTLISEAGRNYKREVALLGLNIAELSKTDQR